MKNQKAVSNTFKALKSDFQNSRILKTFTNSHSKTFNLHFLKYTEAWNNGWSMDNVRSKRSFVRSNLWMICNCLAKNVFCLSKNKFDQTTRPVPGAKLLFQVLYTTHEICSSIGHCYQTDNELTTNSSLSWYPHKRSQIICSNWSVCIWDKIKDSPLKFL